MIAVYAAWFRDSNMLPDDQDYEWPAAFEIEAETAEQAQAWGDFLAMRYQQAHSNETFLWSEIRLPNDPIYKNSTIPAPRVSVKQNPNECDEIIGWSINQADNFKETSK